MTNVFVERFISNFSRTRDQMIQTARSGKQNIIEGMNDFETSKNTGINLINIAKGSMLELLEDYEDYLFYRFLQSLSEKFLEEGGFKEKMRRMRVERRNER